MPATPRLVLITVPDLEQARLLTQAILQRRLAAGISIIPAVESHYWWQGKLDSAAEVMLLIRSSAEHFDRLAALVQEKHSYVCPEIVAWTPQEMSSAYRAWWTHEMSPD